MDQQNVATFREPTYGPLVYKLLRYLVGPVLRLLWVKKVSGLENLPRNQSVILAANHSSYFDFIITIAVCPLHIHFMAAEVFYTKPLTRILFNTLGQIRVDRDHKDKEHVHRAVGDILNTGKVLGIFPEGTRSLTGELQKPYTGVTKYSLQHKVPVVPVGIKGAYHVWPKGQPFPRFKKVIEIHFGKPRDFPHLHEAHHKGELDIDAYATATHEIMLDVAELTGQKYEHHKSGK